MRIPTKRRVRETYEAIADSYASSRREPWPEVTAFIHRLPTGSRVADLGCGSGRHVAVLVARGHHVLGVDFSRRLLRAARGAYQFRPGGIRPHWAEADVARLPLRDRTFDACICVAVLHHLPSQDDRISALQEIRRILVDSGSAFLSVWSLEQPRFRAVADARRAIPTNHRGDVEVPWTLPDGTVVPRYYHLFQRGELEQLIIESGLQGETFFESSGNYFVLVSKHG